MKNGNWIPIDKNAIYKLSPRAKKTQHSEQSAYLSLRLDLDNNNVKGLRDYGRIWNWSAGKVYKFFKRLNYKTGESMETLQKHLRRQTETPAETDIRLILNDLDKGKKTPLETNGNTSGDTPETHTIILKNNPILTKKIKPKKEVEKKDFFLDLIPEELNGNGFIESWKEWVNYRKKIKKSLNEFTVKKQLKLLLKQPDAIACIDQTIEKGWKGLFKVKDIEETNQNIWEGMV